MITASLIVAGSAPVSANKLNMGTKTGASWGLKSLWKPGVKLQVPGALLGCSLEVVAGGQCGGKELAYLYVVSPLLYIVWHSSVKGFGDTSVAIYCWACVSSDLGDPTSPNLGSQFMEYEASRLVAPCIIFLLGAEESVFCFVPVKGFELLPDQCQLSAHSVGARLPVGFLEHLHLGL
ncbi:hypothetical protein NDU88_004674 [Pleurodeles waltl]|uniref:Uncharacterized protein n=1 Tax=Pleurodeles waltl TaxID=8319 RepID=A0AAV7V1R2_PLEWA|nr:hypothetical protein NDU88_004674 [Pleurodeles waltl]